MGFPLNIGFAVDPSRPAPESTGSSFAGSTSSAVRGTVGVGWGRTTETARRAKAPEASGTTHGSASLHNFCDALRDQLPFRIILDLELIAHSLQHPLAHLLRIEVVRTILRGDFTGLEKEQGGDAY